MHKGDSLIRQSDSVSLFQDKAISGNEVVVDLAGKTGKRGLTKKC